MRLFRLNDAVLSAICLAAILSGGTVRGDSLSLGSAVSTLNGTSTMTWNRATNPGSSPDSFTLTLLNNTPAGQQTQSVAAWAVGLELVPINGATGTLSISTVSNPSSNNVLSDPAAPQLNSFSGYVDLSNYNANGAGNTGVGNLATLNFTSSNAVGDFYLEAINQDSSNAQSNWSDANYPYDDYPFTNVTSTGSPVSTILGEVVVTDPAPEPSTFALLAGVFLGGGFAQLWRRRRGCKSTASC
jgi:hypothetical protein